jgi:hypothetical protein
MPRYPIKDGGAVTFKLLGLPSARTPTAVAERFELTNSIRTCGFHIRCLVFSATLGE